MFNKYPLYKVPGIIPGTFTYKRMTRKMYRGWIAHFREIVEQTPNENWGERRIKYWEYLNSWFLGSDGISFKNKIKKKLLPKTFIEFFFGC